MKMRLRQTYLVATAILALVFLGYSFRSVQVGFDLRLIVFLALLVVNSRHQVETEDYTYSINFPLLFPAMVCFGPGWASLLAIVGLISSNELQSPMPVFLFNRGSLGLATGLAAATIAYLGGPGDIAASIIGGLLVYVLTNEILVHIGERLYDPKTCLLPRLVETGKTILPSAAITALFYVLYTYLDIFGLIGAYYTLTWLRSGALLTRLETNYRISLIKSLLRAVYAKDKDLMVHLERVSEYSLMLAKRCGYPRWKLAVLEEAAYFHDIGKLEIADDILKKPARLTDNEYAEMKNHPKRGLEFLAEIPLPRTHRTIVQNIAYSHHEYFNGAGYPCGKKGTEIPIEARIVAIADTWEAMTGSRCYRKPLTPEEAINELRRVKGQQLDPQLVDIFIEIINERMPKKPQHLITAKSTP